METIRNQFHDADRCRELNVLIRQFAADVRRLTGIPTDRGRHLTVDLKFVPLEFLPEVLTGSEDIMMHAERHHHCIIQLSQIPDNGKFFITLTDPIFGTKTIDTGEAIE